MPKEYLAFQQEYAAIQKEVDKQIEAINNSKRYTQQTDGVILHGYQEIGLQIQKLKDKGARGATIADFTTNADVKKMAAEIDLMRKGMTAEFARLGTLQQSSFAPAVARFKKLRADLQAEITVRQKQLSTKVGTGNKSLPDMVKLLAAVDAYEKVALHYGTLRDFKPPKLTFYTAKWDKLMTQTMSQTKEHALSALQEMMDEQAFNVRVLAGNVGRAKTLRDEVVAQVKAALAARQASNASALAAAQQKAAKALKDLGGLVEPYDRGAKDSWFMGQLSISKDKDKIAKGIKDMHTLHTQAEQEMKKVGS